jgi:multiple sugar transport system substrate-binding protein
MLGGQGISVVKYSDKKEMALEYMKWFAQPAIQKKWWEGGGFTCHNAVLNAPGFETSTPYAKVFLDSMKMVKDFWAEPSYAALLLAMQNRVHDYVVAGKGTPEQALNQLEKDWEEVFKEDGKLK